jgi:hypothetical protein
MRGTLGYWSVGSRLPHFNYFALTQAFYVESREIAQAVYHRVLKTKARIQSQRYVV